MLDPVFQLPWKQAAFFWFWVAVILYSIAQWVYSDRVLKETEQAGVDLDEETEQYIALAKRYKAHNAYKPMSLGLIICGIVLCFAVVGI